VRGMESFTRYYYTDTNCLPQLSIHKSGPLRYWY